MNGCLCRCFVLLISCMFSALPTGAQQASAIDLDLSSTAASLTPGHLVDSQPVNIKVGDTNLPVTSSSILTPAERLAVYQVVSTGQQSIVLGAQGNAIGGSFTIGPHFSQYVNALKIPQGVTAIKNFGTSASLDLTGNFTNSGTFYAVSSNSAVTNAVINAANITNTQGALLTSVLPQGGLTGLSNLLPNLSMTLNAVNNILNAGTISSSGFLTVTAGGSIINALPAGASGPSPIMQAFANMNLQTANLINSGMIASQAANINIATLNVANLLVNNSGGLLSATAGIIDIRDSGFFGKVTSDILGGIIDSKELNIFAAGGSSNVRLDSTNATLNMVAHDAHTSVNTGNLILGNMTLTGDPDFYSLAGDVLLQGGINTAGAPLAVVAGQNITTTNVSPLSLTTNGGNLILLAGANFTCAGACGGQVPPAAPANDTLSISSFKATGTIDLSQTITLSTLNAAGSGGNVTMVAPGSITLPNAGTLRTSGTGFGNKSGNVQIIAGADNGVAVSGAGYTIQTCATGNSGATSGDISITNYHPTILPGAFGNPNIDLVNGDYAANSGTPGGIVPGGGDINLKGLLSFSNSNGINAGRIDIEAPGGNATVTGNILAAGNNNGSGGNVTINAGRLITTGYVDAQSFLSPAGLSGGNVFMNSSGGGITTGDIWTTGDTAGDISLRSSIYDGIRTGDLLGIANTKSAFFALDSAGNPITTGRIDASNFNGKGGTVNLTAGTFGNLTGKSVNASSTNNRGGSISITGALVSMSGTIGASIYSLRADGPLQGGFIDVCASEPTTPFLVGSFSSHGTAGSITADGAGASVHLSTSPLSIALGHTVSAIGGTVSLDRNCCRAVSPIMQTELSATRLLGVQVADNSRVLAIGSNTLALLGENTAGETYTGYGAAPNDKLATRLPSFTDAINTQSPTRRNAFVAPALPQSVFIQPKIISPLAAKLIALRVAKQLENKLLAKYGPKIAKLIGQDAARILESKLIGQDAHIVANDGAALIGQGAATLIGQDAAKIVANDGAALIGQDAGNLIGQEAANIVANDGAALIGQDAAKIVANDGAALIGQDGAGLIGLDTATLLSNQVSLIGNDGSTLIGNDGSTLVGPNVPSVISHNGSAAIAQNASTLIGQDAGQLRASGWSGNLCPGCGGGIFKPMSSTSSTSANVVIFEKGAALYAPEIPIVVAAANTSIGVAKDSVILLLKTDSALAIYNLHDTHSGSVTVETGKKTIHIGPGEVLTLSSIPGKFEEVCPGHGVSYRNARAIKTTTKTTAYVSEFSISSALANVPPLHYIATKGTPAQRRVAAAILKDAAIKMQTNGSKSAFKSL